MLHRPEGCASSHSLAPVNDIIVIDLAKASALPQLSRFRLQYVQTSVPLSSISKPDRQVRRLQSQGPELHFRHQRPSINLRNVTTEPFSFAVLAHCLASPFHLQTPLPGAALAAGGARAPLLTS